MKKMNNYNFTMNWYGGLTEEMFLTAMKTNNASDIFELDDKYGDCYCKIKENKDEPEYRAIAILENGYVDIETDFYMNEDFEPVIDFYVCKKYGEKDNDWCTDGFCFDVIGEDMSMMLPDFSKENWKEQLERLMLYKLDKYCKVKSYDYTKPIKN